MTDITAFLPTVATFGSTVASRIPAAPLRRLVDGLFPLLSKCPEADYLSGFGHRWRGGHDLLLDVLPDLAHSPAQKLRQAGHILLTDFPTKAGIPIPAFSQSGLGGFLVEKVGINHQWLCVNMWDTCSGIFCMGEGAGDLVQAINGTLKPNLDTFMDTFGEGAMEAAGALCTKNPLLAASAMENIAAGAIVYAGEIAEQFRRITGMVDMESVLGQSFCALLLGSSISYLLEAAQRKPTDWVAMATRGGRSALVGALSAVSSSFAVGASLAFSLHYLGRKYAESQHKRFLKAQDISPELLQMIVNDNMHNEVFRNVWNRGFINLDTLPLLEMDELPAPSLGAMDIGQRLSVFMELPSFHVDLPTPQIGLPTPVVELPGMGGIQLPCFPH